MSPSQPARTRRLGRVATAAVFAVLTAATISAIATPQATAAPSATGEFNYAEALQESMLFYESQRSGKLPADNRVSWRGDSDLTDGSPNLDLTGGYHDAGDEVKFGFPGAYAMTALAWGGVANPAGYTKSNQTQFLLRNLRWGDDYIIKAHPSANVLYGQVGDGSSDHAFWGAPEVNPSPRPSFAVTSTCPGSDLAGESAAALAASSILFQSSDSSYAATLRSQAASIYQFGDTFRGTYDSCISAASGFYHSFSGFMDDLTWGAIWLYKATGDTSYLTKAQTYYAQMPKAQQTTTPEFAWTVSWDDKSYACYVLMAELTGQRQYIDDAERNLDWFTSNVNGNHVNTSPGGEAVVDVWGTARYAANAAFLALEMSNYLKSQGIDTAKAQVYHDFAVRQINYILGDNPLHISYEVGFTNGGKNTAWPKNVHSRGAHGSWTNNINDPVNNRHTAIGELVGGPNQAGSDAYTDDRNNFQQNEGALDYNALFSGALSELTNEFGGTPLSNFPPKETPDGPEMLVQAAPNAIGTNFIEIKAVVYNKSAWPARALTNGSFRYYFTLDPGESASQLSFSSPFNQCSPPTGATQFSGSTYYVELSCAGQSIVPAGQSESRREVQFRIIFPAAHDYTKDWSFQGLPGTAGATPVNANNITLFDGSTQVWGSPPGTTSTSPSPSVTPSVQVSPSISPSPSISRSPSVSPSASASRSPSTSPSVSPSASSSNATGTACKVTYAKVSDWGTGFQANVTIANTGTTVLDPWTLRFTFPGNQIIVQNWSATWTWTGAAVTAVSLSWNGLQPGANTTVGFIANYSGTNANPTGFTVNNVACSLG
jgi:endoglucanase